jgi:hypothetical protein
LLPTENEEAQLKEQGRVNLSWAVTRGQARIGGRSRAFFLNQLTAKAFQTSVKLWRLGLREQGSQAKPPHPLARRPLQWPPATITYVNFRRSDQLA